MATKSKKTVVAAPKKSKKRAPREGSKLAKALALYSRKNGATTTEIRKTNGWGPMNYGIARLRKLGFAVKALGEGRFAV